MHALTNRLLMPLVAVALMFSSSPARAASPEEATLDAARMEPFAVQMLKYKATEKVGDLPGPWVPGAWADGAVGRIELVRDAGDGKPAVRMTNVSGQPSLMFKPWQEISLPRSRWTVTVEYRKAGKTAANLAIAKGHDLKLPPTGDGFETKTLSFDAVGDGMKVQPTMQLYAGTGEGEALFVRQFKLARGGAISPEAKAAEERAAAERDTEAQTVAKREAARRAAERKSINGWVRPEAKPVKMDKPLDPPPVTGKTYFVATTGSNENGDGSKDKPWRSIQHGMNQLHPGDLLYVRGGEYRESMLNFARSGRADAYITVAGYPGEQAKVIHGGGGLAVFNISSGSQWTPVRLEEQAYLVIRDLHIDAVNANQAVRVQGPMMLPDYKGNVAKSRGMIHNIWIAGCDITGGNGNESVLGAGYGAHDVVLSNNRIHDMVGGVNAFLFSDGTIIEFNEVFNTSTEQDDAGAIKSMAPGVIIRYNKVHGNNRSPIAKKPGWAPTSEGGKQWRFLQGVSGIYCDFAMVDDKNNIYPEALVPEDPANYVYGNTVYNNNAGIFAFLSDHVQVYDNVIYGNGRANTGGWVEGKEGGKWLEFVGPAGYGINVNGSTNAKVWNNISYDNEKAGLAVEGAVWSQYWNNVFFGNDLAQIHVRKGERFAMGFNAILVGAGKPQGPPLRRDKDDFATADAFRQKFPYHDEGTQIVQLTAGTAPLERARQLLQEQAVTDAAWRDANQRLTAKAVAAGIGKPAETVAQAPYDPSGSLQVPLPKALPGTIELENYDVGGPGVSFKDDDGENQGGHYRKDAVDVKASPKAGNGAVVGFTANGEWMEYTISVAQAGAHPLSITYATPEAGRRIRLTLDGKPLGEPITFVPTGDWDQLETTPAGTVTLPAGDAVLRVTIESGPVDLDRLRIGDSAN